MMMTMMMMVMVAIYHSRFSPSSSFRLSLRVEESNPTLESQLLVSQPLRVSLNGVGCRYGHVGVRPSAVEPICIGGGD